MARLFKFSKEQILNAAYDLVKDYGIEKLSARTIGNKLNSSSKVVFSWFDSMDELAQEVYEKALSEFDKTIYEALADTSKPAYINCGLAYINFAISHPNIYSLLFYKNSFEKPSRNNKELKTLNNYLIKKYSLKIKEATNINFKYRIFVHGLADLLVNDDLVLSKNVIEEMIIENYKNLVNSALSKIKR